MRTAAWIAGYFALTVAGCQIAPRPGERATDAGTVAAHDARSASATPPANMYGSAADLPQAEAPRSAAAIQAVIRAHAPESRDCYERELIGRPRLAGSVVLHLEIAPDGSVANAQIGESTLPPEATTGPCIAAAARRWRFAPAPGSTVATRVNYPFVFSIDDGTAPPRRPAHPRAQH